MKSLALLFLLAMSTSVASAQTNRPDMSAFGFLLGEKFAAPECERESHQDSITSAEKRHTERVERIKRERTIIPGEMEYEDARFTRELKEYERRLYQVGEHSTACFQWSAMDDDYVSVNTPLVTARVRIELPIEQMPVIAVDIEAQIVDGSLESVWFSTAGLVSQEKDLVSLEKKYGKATRFENENKQNAFGAHISSHYAEWRFANLTVLFWGTTNSADRGQVRIETKKSRAFAKAVRAKSEGPPL
jgi:hypothetical protein